MEICPDVRRRFEHLAMPIAPSVPMGTKPVVAAAVQGYDQKRINNQCREMSDGLFSNSAPLSWTPACENCGSGESR
jgi:hypothetical protein